jgi:hypothetical protein
MPRQRHAFLMDMRAVWAVDCRPGNSIMPSQRHAFLMAMRALWTVDCRAGLSTVHSPQALLWTVDTVRGLSPDSRASGLYFAKNAQLPVGHGSVVRAVLVKVEVTECTL